MWKEINNKWKKYQANRVRRRVFRQFRKALKNSKLDPVKADLIIRKTDEEIAQWLKILLDIK